MLNIYNAAEKGLRTIRAAGLLQEHLGIPRKWMWRGMWGYLCDPGKWEKIDYIYCLGWRSSDVQTWKQQGGLTDITLTAMNTPGSGLVRVSGAAAEMRRCLLNVADQVWTQLLCRGFNHYSQRTGRIVAAQEAPLTHTGISVCPNKDLALPHIQSWTCIHTDGWVRREAQGYKLEQRPLHTGTAADRNKHVARFLLVHQIKFKILRPLIQRHSKDFPESAKHDKKLRVNTFCWCFHLQP